MAKHFYVHRMDSVALSRFVPNKCSWDIPCRSLSFLFSNHSSTRQNIYILMNSGGSAPVSSGKENPQ